MATTGRQSRQMTQGRLGRLVAILFGLQLGPVGGAPAPDRIVGIGVTGTTLEVRLASGRVLAGLELKGATLQLVAPGELTPQKVRIDDVIFDPKDSDHETLLYRMQAIDPVTGAATALCNPDASGERWAFPVQGQWDGGGNHISNQGFTLTCGDGAQGKCVRFGYKPWKVLADGTRLADYHQACVRLVRADYCGNKGTTRDGMLIDYYDRLGIVEPDPHPERKGLRFEAAWTAKGAACVAHTRVPENITLEQLGKECPRLVGHLGPEACKPESDPVSKEPVLMYNRSR